MYLEGVLTAAAEALLPGLCPSCREVLPGGDRGLCGRCWSHIIPLAGPACPRCGVPVEDASVACLECARSAPCQSATVFWGEYDGTLRTAILALKHGGRDEFAQALGNRLAATVAACPWAESVDTVCSVPSHPLRRFKRPWSAAEQLGRAVARALRLPYAALLRRHGLYRQTGRSRTRRLTLPKRTFTGKVPAATKKILLVDDVATTGTTLRLAAQALRQAGAEAVFCAAMAHAPDSRRI